MGAITLMMTAMSGPAPPTAIIAASLAAASPASQLQTASAPHSSLPRESVGGCVGATSVSASMTHSTRSSQHQGTASRHRHRHRHHSIAGTRTRIATADMGVITSTMTAMFGTLKASTAAASIASQLEIASAPHSSLAQEDVGGCVGATLASVSTSTSSKFMFAEHEC